MTEPVEQPIDARRAAEALRRSRRLVVGFVLGLTALVALVSLLSPPRYRASAAIVHEDARSSAETPGESPDRLLATTGRLVTAPRLLAKVARTIPGESTATLEAKVDATVDPDSDVLDVTATDEAPRKAAAVANAVARTFLAEHAEREAARAARVRERLAAEFGRLQDAAAAPRSLDAIREQLSELAVAEVDRESLRLAGAVPPAAPFAPKPMRNAVLALLAALFLAILFALARNRLRPTIGDPRELSRIVGLPLLVVLPDGAPRHARLAAVLEWVQARVERLPLAGPLATLRARSESLVESHAVVVREAEATLRAAVLDELPPGRRHVVLVSGTDPGVGAHRVAELLACSLARAGHATLHLQVDARATLAPKAAEPRRRRGRPRLVRVAGLGDFDRVLDRAARSGCRYVVVATPPVAGGIEAQVIARRSEAAIVVGRPERTVVSHAAETRDLIDALGLHGLGVVSTCAHAAAGLAGGAPERLRPVAGVASGGEDGTAATVNGRARAAEPASNA